MQFLSLISLIFSSLNFINTEKTEESSHPYEPNQYFKVSREKLFTVSFLFTYRISSTQVSLFFSPKNSPVQHVKCVSSTQIRRFKTKNVSATTRVRNLSQVEVRDQSSPPGLSQRHFNTQTYVPHQKNGRFLCVQLTHLC